MNQSTSALKRPEPALLVLGATLAVAVAVPSNDAAPSAGRLFAMLASGLVLSIAFVLLQRRVVAPAAVWVGMGVLVGMAAFELCARAWALDPGASMLEAARWALFALVVGAAYAASARRSSRIWICVAITLAGAYVAVPLGWKLLLDGSFAIREQGLLGYWNVSAALGLVCALSAAALLAVQVQEGAGRRMPTDWLHVTGAAALMVLAGSAATATASRGALAALAFGMIVLVARAPDRWLMFFSACAAIVGMGTTLALASTLADVPGVVKVLLAIVVSMVSGIVATRSIAIEVLFRQAPPNDGAVGREWPQIRRWRGTVGWLALMAFAAAIIVSFAARDEGRSATQDPGNVSRLASTNDSLRSTWWKEAVEIWKDAPIVGSGGGAFAASRAGSTASGDAAKSPHSLPLQLLTEGGIVIFAAFLLLLVVFVRAANGAPRTPERAFAAGALTLWLVQALADWTWTFPQLLLPIGLAVGVVLPRTVSSEARVEPRNAVATIAAVVALGAVAALAVVPYAAHRIGQRATSHLEAGDATAAARSAGWSWRLVPSLDMVFTRTAALDATGDSMAADRFVTASQQVWFLSPVGLQFVLDRGRLTDRERERVEQRQSELSAASAVASLQQEAPPT